MLHYSLLATSPTSLHRKLSQSLEGAAFFRLVVSGLAFALHSSGRRDVMDFPPVFFPSVTDLSHMDPLSSPEKGSVTFFTKKLFTIELLAAGSFSPLLSLCGTSLPFNGKEGLSPLERYPTRRTQFFSILKPAISTLSLFHGLISELPLNSSGSHVYRRYTSHSSPA